MDLYNKLKAQKTTTSPGDFKNMIHGLFEFDESHNMYEDFSKAPLFYRRFIAKDTTEFFDTLLNIIPDEHMHDVYKGANLFTLMAAATFHMNKLYCIRYKITTLREAKKAAKYISKPFIKWATDIHKKYGSTLNYNQDVPSFAKPYTYIFLNSYVMPENLYDNINYNLYKEFSVDMLGDIIIPLTNDNYVDIYGFGLNQYRLWDNIDKEYHITSEFIAIHQSYLKVQKHPFGIENEPTFRKSFGKIGQFKINTDKIYKYVKKIPLEKYGLCILLNSVKICLYDMKIDPNRDPDDSDEDEGDLIPNEKVELITANVLKLIEFSDNLIQDAAYYIGLVDMTLFYYINHIKVSAFYPFVRNIIRNPITKNIKFVTLYILSVLASHYDNIFNTYYTDNFDNEYSHQTDIEGNRKIYEFATQFNDDYIPDVLDYILDQCFTYGVSPVAQSPYSSLEFGLKKTMNYHKFLYQQLSSPSPSPTTRSPSYNPQYELAKKLKQIISILISYSANRLYKRDHFKYKKLIRKLKKYETELTELGLDIDKYIAPVGVLDSPPSYRSNRSVNNSRITSDINVLFSKFNEHFTKYAEKLSKIYVRSVQSDDDSENNGDRIEKIREYIIKKYGPSRQVPTSIIRSVTSGSEYNVLYYHWVNVLKKKKLIRTYKIYYGDAASENGIDAGGVWRTFIAEVADQLQSRFKKVSDSERYILADDVSWDEASFIGELLGLFIVNSVYLRFNLSIVYLAHLMFNRQHMKDDENFLYFLLDMDNTQMLRFLKPCEYEIPDPNDPDEFLYCDSKNILTEYNYIDKYKIGITSLFQFSISFNRIVKNKIFYTKFKDINDKIRIFDMDKLLSVMDISPAAYKSGVLDTLQLTFWNYRDDDEIITRDHPAAQCYRDIEYFLLSSEEEYRQLYDALDLGGKEKYNKKIDYCRALLQFWTGAPGIIPTSVLNDTYRYTVVIIQHTSKKVPLARTCFNRLELPLYENNAIIYDRDSLFKWFMQRFVDNQHKPFGLA